MTDDRLLVVLATTPRTGSTWLHSMLTAALDADLVPDGQGQAQLGRPGVVDYPTRALVAGHAPPTPDVIAHIASLDGRVVTLARHPLDTLVSLYQFAPVGRQDPGASLGYDDDVWPLLSGSPASESFIRFAEHPRTKELMAISAAWWLLPGVVQVRYEELLADTARVVTHIVATVGEAPRRPIEAVVSEHRFEALRARAIVEHFWRGQAGLWRDLVPASTASRLADLYREVFRTTGYPAPDGDRDLVVDQADARWYRMLAESRTELAARLRAKLEHEHRRATEFAERCADLERSAALHPDRFGSLGPRSLRVARAAQRLAEAVRRLRPGR